LKWTIIKAVPFPNVKIRNKIQRLPLISTKMGSGKFSGEFVNLSK
jgi:hypothetical protein